MEIYVESAEGYAIASGCYVSVRLGDTLKQGRYEPQRVYRFPNVERRRNAKIDLYEHMGSCVVSVDPDAKSVHDVWVSRNDPQAPPMRLKVNVEANSADIGKQREKRAQAVKCQAKEYLAKHGIEETLSEAVKALLKLQPIDPTDFLCRYLGGDLQPQDGNCKPGKDKVSVVPPPQAASKGAARSAPTGTSLIPFRPYCSNHMKKVCGTAFWSATFAKFPSRRPVHGGARPTEVGSSVAFDEMRLEQKARVSHSDTGSEAKTTHRLRRQVCERLLQASRNGDLNTVLARLHGDPSPLETSGQGSSSRREQCSAQPMLIGGSYFHMAYLVPTRFMCL
eukprot:TRINITY_DN64247_c0_g1_i1.p1 TRINITY_DN64247_c0_g1~~TRINITY_DN64247_c0_g1_i1.p1  ORF type:complete len:336 (-),score=42.58 TRINITY_DN64247_c0_g1_i1:120-1127(-)